MVFRKAFPLLLLGLVACAQTDENAKMSLSLCDQGKVLLREGKPAEARDIYLSAVSRDDGNARAWNGLGVSNSMLGKRGDAREAYKRALDLQPEDMIAANNLAHLELEEGRSAAAVELLEKLAADEKAPATLKENYAKAVRATQPVPVAAPVAQPVVPVVKESKAVAKVAPRAAAKVVAAPAPKAASSPVQRVEIDVKVLPHYADLGEYPTDAMARARVARLKADDRFPEGVSLEVFPDVKAVGGTPQFAVRATGKEPAEICEEMKALEAACVAR